MSVRLAAGWSSPNSHGVSVVPMIQWEPHGSTNSTLFSVGRISASRESMRSRGTTMCTPLDGWTGSGDATPASRSISVVQTPVALTVTRALMSKSRSPSRSRALTPAIAGPSWRKSVTSTAGTQQAPWAEAVPASVTAKRASSTCAS